MPKFAAQATGAIIKTVAPELFLMHHWQIGEMVTKYPTRMQKCARVMWRSAKASACNAPQFRLDSFRL